MSRVQLALNVSNLEQAVEFYSKLFDTAPAKVRPGYANFAVIDPPLKLVLIESAAAPGSLNHLGVEVGTAADVAAAQRRLVGARVGHRGRGRRGLLLRRPGQGVGRRSGPRALGDLHGPRRLRASKRHVARRRARRCTVLRRRSCIRRALLLTRWDRDLVRRASAEAVGTGFLVAIVVGSGIAAQRLSPGNIGLQLLENSTATGAGLVALILAFGPISGAHFNPVVTLADRILAGTSTRDACAYMGAQIAGGCIGAIVANLMFDLPRSSWSTHHRSVRRRSGSRRSSQRSGCSGDPGCRAIRSIAGRRLRGGRVHRRRVLVHVVDELRQPGRHHRPLADEHLCRHRARRACLRSSSPQVVGALVAVGLARYWRPTLPAEDIVITHEEHQS